MALTTKSAFGFTRAWVARSLRMLRDDPGLFEAENVEEAVLQLGIGKRKVGALYFWLRVLGLVDENGAAPHGLSPMGEMVLEWDPSCQEVGTWCLFHYQLASDPDGASGYWWLTNHCQLREITREAMVQSIASGYPDVSERTVSDAVAMLLQVFDNTPIGDELGFYRPTTGGKYERESPSAHTLHPAVFAECLIRWATTRGRDTVNLEEEMIEPGGVGRILNLTREETETRLVEWVFIEVEGGE